MRGRATSCSGARRVFLPRSSCAACIRARGGDGSAGFVLKGIDQLDYSGASASGAGDLNGDGIDDVVIGALLADPHGRNQAGKTYVVFGRATGFPAVFDLRNLHPQTGGDGSAGFILQGIDAEDLSGRPLSGAGDVNGDGIADLLIGAPLADPDNQAGAGESYVVFGRSARFPAVVDLRGLHPRAGGDGSAGFIIKGIEAGDASGSAVSGAGDVNGDGVADLIIGAYRADPNAQESAGESYVVFGRVTGFPAVFELRSLHSQAGGDGSEGFILKGIDVLEYSGRSVSGAGDLNGDGIADLLIGAHRANVDGEDGAGKSYVVFGRATGFPAVFELRSLYPRGGGDGSAGLVLHGHDAFDGSGRSVSAAGDVNGDGFADLVIGAGLAEHDDRDAAGESYIVFGRDTAT
jgi:hypothetical protein